MAVHYPSNESRQEKCTPSQSKVLKDK